MEKKEDIKKAEEENIAEKPKEEAQKKPQKKKISEVIINGLNLRISTKVGADICKMIRYKNIDSAIKMMEEVMAMRKPVKMVNREKPHQHGKGISGAAYPVNAAGDFLRILKQLKSTAIYHELEIEKSIIAECKCNKASKPYKRGGARAKRAHVFIRLKQKKQEEAKKS